MRYFILFFIFSTSFKLGAQCCSPGNPIGGISQLGTLTKNQATVFIGYKYGYSGNYFEGGTPITSTGANNGHYQFVGISFFQGLSSRLMLEIESGFMVEKRINFSPPILPSNFTGRGLTDISFGPRVALIKNEEAKFELSMGAGIKLPLSSGTKTSSGIILPIDVQPSSGSIDFYHTTYFNLPISTKRLKLFFLNRIEIKGENSKMYRFGTFLSSSFFFSYTATPKLKALLQVRSEFRGRDSRPYSGFGIQFEPLREYVIPTGSEKIFLVPQLIYNVTNDWAFSIVTDIPLYQYYKGQQLASTFAVNINVIKTFDKKRKNSVECL